MGTYHQYDEVWQFDIKNDVLSMDFTRDRWFQHQPSIQPTVYSPSSIGGITGWLNAQEHNWSISITVKLSEIKGLISDVVSFYLFLIAALNCLEIHSSGHLRMICWPMLAPLSRPHFTGPPGPSQPHEKTSSLGSFWKIVLVAEFHNFHQKQHETTHTNNQRYTHEIPWMGSIHGAQQNHLCGDNCGPGIFSWHEDSSAPWGNNFSEASNTLGPSIYTHSTHDLIHVYNLFHSVPIFLATLRDLDGNEAKLPLVQSPQPQGPKPSIFCFAR
jgi:hypothetical protein